MRWMNEEELEALNDENGLLQKTIDSSPFHTRMKARAAVPNPASALLFILQRVDRLLSMELALICKSQLVLSHAEFFFFYLNFKGRTDMATWVLGSARKVSPLSGPIYHLALFWFQMVQSLVFLYCFLRLRSYIIFPENF